MQQGSKGHFVWVVDRDNKAQSRPVTVGDWHGDDWFIDEGLQSGDRVVVDGTLALTPGAAVQISQAGATAAADRPSAPAPSAAVSTK